MLRQQRRFFRSVLIGSDLAVVVAAGVAAYGLRFYAFAGVRPPAGGDESFAYSTHAIPMEFAAPIMMLALLWVGQYRPRRDERFFLEAGTIVKGVAIGLGATIVTLSMFQNILFGGRHYSGMQFMLYGACAAMGLLAWRFSFRMALRRLRAGGLNLRHVAIIGDMSLVGPRPMAELISGIRDEWQGCMQRQNVKPGITGWAQVNGHRGHTSLRKRLQYNLFYFRNWSMMFDMRILRMTLFRGFANPHAN